MVWLQQAVAAGYSDVTHMRKDSDLDALRDRDDFKLVQTRPATRKRKSWPHKAARNAVLAKKA